MLIGDRFAPCSSTWPVAADPQSRAIKPNPEGGAIGLAEDADADQSISSLLALFILFVNFGFVADQRAIDRDCDLKGVPLMVASALPRDSLRVSPPA